MKLIIDIDENIYQTIVHTDEYSFVILSMEGLKRLDGAIRNGKPLPKGHGNLKDVDAIHKEIEKLQNGISKQGGQVHISRDQYKGLCYARGIINEAQTIIEADGG